MTEFRSQFRIPKELADKLKQSAADNHRSLNSELVARLEISFTDTAEQLDRIESALNSLLARQ